MLETTHLYIRPWLPSDAENLFKYAKNPIIGAMAGWPPHKSITDSISIIQNILDKPETFAIALKSKNTAIGSVGLKIGNESLLRLPPNEAEIGYWIGTPFWGQGFVPEAVQALLPYCFLTLNLHAIWCVSLPENQNSQKVQKKCGFHSQGTVLYPHNGVLKEHVVSYIKNSIQ